jgi:hypothetical protein
VLDCTSTATTVIENREEFEVTELLVRNGHDNWTALLNLSLRALRRGVSRHPIVERWSCSRASFPYSGADVDQCFAKGRTSMLDDFFTRSTSLQLPEEGCNQTVSLKLLFSSGGC